MIILGIKTCFDFSEIFILQQINEKVKYHTPERKVTCLPLGLISIAFQISHSPNIKGHAWSKINIFKFHSKFRFPNAPVWIKLQCKGCITCNWTTLSTPEASSGKKEKDFKRQSIYFNHSISIDTKGPIPPSSEKNSHVMVKRDDFTHYMALNPVLHLLWLCNTLRTLDSKIWITRSPCHRQGNRIYEQRNHNNMSPLML